MPSQSPPGGFTAREDAGGTARILTANDPRGSSALATLRSGITALAGYFDSRPVLSGGIADERDQHAQAFFSTTLKRQPVTGVVAAASAGKPAFTALFDRPRSLGGSLARLAPGLPGFELAARGSGGLPPMRRVELPDRSGTIELPEGWRLVAGQKGSCDVAGPRGETLSLGAAAPVWTNPMARVSGLFVAPFSEPVTALKTLSPQIAAALTRAGQPAPRLLRVIESQPIRSPLGRAALILYESDLGGRRYLSLALVITSVTGAEQWMYYYSGATAPAEHFARQLPLLRAIWESFSVSPGELQRRMDEAVQSMQETWGMLRDAQSNATRASLNAAEGWDQVIRGVQTIEPRSGFRAEVPHDKTQQWVDRLNETGTGRWRVVPMAELIKP